MSRDKQLIVRVEGEKREKFKKFCQANGLDMSSFLYELIGRFVDGSLTLENVTLPTTSVIDSEVIAEIKKSVVNDLSGMIESQVKQAIAELTPPAQIPETDQVDNVVRLPEMDQVVATFDGASTEQKEDVVTDIVTTVTSPFQGDLLGEVETAIEPSDITEKIQESIEGQDIKIPDWLIPNKEYEQNDFAAAIGCDPGTVTKVFKGDIKRSRKADLNVLLSLKDSGKLIQTQGGKWIFRP